MSDRLLSDLDNMRDECGCSLLEGRCATHRAMVTEIWEAWQSMSERAAALLWTMQDGYGEPGFMPEQGYDWSGIRDSSCAAIEQMWKAVHA